MVELIRFGSRAKAEELQFVLRGGGVPSRLVQERATGNGHGWWWVLHVPAEQIAAARRILAEEGVTPEQAVEEVAAPQAVQQRPALHWVVGLIVANVLVWIAMEGAGGSEQSSTLLRFGAARAALLSEGEWWRSVTAVFIHIGFRHLLANMITLGILGWAVLQAWGAGRFYFMYLIAGVAGNWVSFALSPTGSIKAGASGAILGLLGVLAATRIRAIRADVRSARPSRFKTWHIIAMLVAFYGFVIGLGRVDHLAHIGGLVAGLVLALVMPPPGQVGRQTDRWLGGALGASSAALAAASALMAYFFAS